MFKALIWNSLTFNLILFNKILHSFEEDSSYVYGIMNKPHNGGSNFVPTFLWIDPKIGHKLGYKVFSGA